MSQPLAFRPRTPTLAIITALAILAAFLARVALAVAPSEKIGSLGANGEFSAPVLSSEPSIDFLAPGSEAAWSRDDLRSFFAEYSDQWEVRIDRRNDRPHLIQGAGISLMPGRGNKLSHEAVGLQSDRALELEDVESLLREFLARFPEVLQVQFFDLRLDVESSHTFGSDQYLWVVEFKQYHQGLPVVGAKVFFRINHGNIVQFGVDRVAEVLIGIRPTIRPDQAFSDGLIQVGLNGQLVQRLDAGSLEIRPAMGVAEERNSRYVGPVGLGYEHRLVWSFVFRLAGEAQSYNLLIDAHSGEVLEYLDLTRYANVRGDVYPLTNTDPLQNVGLPYTSVANNGPNTTDADGVYAYSGGTSTAQLDGRYILINDNCGAISLSDNLTGELDFGGSGGTDCATPGFGGAGNTHASRTGYYHLTSINRKAKTYLPGNTWLDGTLTANMNIDDTCNAFWSPGTASINFYQSGDGCSNTGEIAAIFLHEWGHGMDHNSGGAASEAGSGEAVGDTFAFLETKIACIGENFKPGVACHNCDIACTGVRDLSAFAIGGGSTIARPDTIESDVGIDCDRLVGLGGVACPYTTPDGFAYRGPMGFEGHCESYIASTANWDLAGMLSATWGESAGWEKMNQIWYGSLMPSKSAYRVVEGGTCNPDAAVDGCGADNWYTVYLAADDNDGDLSNGTPNGFLIWDAFNAHGIACGERPPPFSDVTGDSWFEPYVLFVLNQGIVNGFPDGTYRPAGNATRAEVLKMAYETVGESFTHPIPDPSFDDVHPADWFYEYVADARAKNFVEGDPCLSRGGTCFFPNEDVNRAEAVKMISVLHRIDGSNAVDFINVDPTDIVTLPDVPQSEWFFPYVNWMANAELTHGPLPAGIVPGQRIVGGYPDGFFRPGVEVNRAEMAKIIANIQQYFSSGASPLPPPSSVRGGGAASLKGSSVHTSIGALYEQPIDSGNLNAPEPFNLSGGNQQTITDPITLIGASQDADSDELFYFWTATGGSFSTADPTNFRTVTWTPPEVPATTTFTIRVVRGDGRGLVGDGTLQFTVPGMGGNSPPTGSITSPTGTQTGTVTVSASASDLDGLARVAVTFASGGSELVLCGAGAASSCTGTSGSWSESGVDPAAFGVSPGLVDMELFVEDSTGDLQPADSHSFTFQPPPPGPGFLLTIVKQGNGDGTVSGGGINCGPGCSTTSISLPEDTPVTLTGSGDQFIGFMGDICYGIDPCSFVMFRDITVHASFALPDSLGVAYTTPANGDSGVSTSTYPTVYFNRDVQPGPNFNSIGFRECGGSSLPFNPVIGNPDTRLTIVRQSSLTHGQCYEVSIPAGAVSDSQGESLATPYSFTFTTEEEGMPQMYVSAYPIWVMEGRETRVSIWFDTPSEQARTIQLSSTLSGLLSHGSSVTLPAGQVLVEVDVDTVLNHGSLAHTVATFQATDSEAGTRSAEISIKNDTPQFGSHLAWGAISVVSEDDGDGVVESGEFAELQFEVVNQGTSDIFNVILNFEVLNTFSSRLRILGGNSECNLGFIGRGQGKSCTKDVRVADQLPTGSYYIQVSGTSSANSILNTARVQVVNNSLPDYLLNAGAFSGNELQPGSQQTVRYTANNYGDGFHLTLPFFEVFIEIEGQEEFLYRTYADVRGDFLTEQTFDLPFTVPATPGEYPIRARINPPVAGQLPESNFANNDATEITLRVAAPDQPPVLDPIGGPFFVNVGSTLSFTVSATDANDDPLTFLLGPGAPAGLSIGSQSGLVTWTPACGQGPQTYTFDVVVRDPDMTTDSETVVVEAGVAADLGVSKTASTSLAVPGETVGFTVVVTNNGPSCVSGVTVTDAFALDLVNVSWTCSASAGSSCSVGQSGDINDSSVALLANGTATYEVTAKIADTATGLVLNQASAAVPVGVTDPNGGNNSDSASITLRDLDFGDAPNAALAASFSYPTLILENGARHGISPGLSLGDIVDGEMDGQPTLTANGDDLAGADDEAGVTFLTDIVPCGSTQVEVSASAAGRLDAWLDFAGDGSWAEQVDQIFGDEPLVPGVNSFTFSVPCSAIPGGSFARFRLSSAGGIGFDGLALDGEVEDYSLLIKPILYTLNVSTNGDGSGGVTILPGGIACGATCSETFPQGTEVTLVAGPAIGSVFTGWSGSGCMGSAPCVLTMDDSKSITATFVLRPATVTRVDTFANTGDGQLLEGEITSAPIERLLVTFDEVMSNPPGDGDIGDVTNSSSYLILGDGGDGFQTAGCASGVDPGDVAIAIDTVSYDAPSRTATVALQGGTLADGVYRFLVCGTLEDGAGNPLDGDADGTGGDDFARTFTVDATPPQVISVGSEPDTGDGVLAEGEATNFGLTGLIVSFDEPLQDPAGDGGTDDATNPANYLLFADGGDGFDTADCAVGVDAGDVGVAIDAVTYDLGSSIATLSLNGALGEGRYRLLVCGTTSVVDLAGSPLDGDGDGSGGDDFARTFLIDQTAPMDPSVSSSSHVPGSWSNVASIGLGWSGASDAGGSGLAGYSLIFDGAPATLPDASIDTGHSTDPHSLTSASLADGSSHYFHLRTCDGATNCTQTVHLGPFWIDGTPPASVSNLLSPSHPVATPVSDATIEVSWDPAVDALSGIDGYAYAFDAGASWACDQSLDLEETVTSTVSPPLGDGSWTFHVCAVDLAGNWSAVASAGPFVVDSSPPRVTGIGSIQNTGDGQLLEGELTSAAISQLLVTFDEGMSDPPGDSGPGDVTNPASYLVFGDGGDSFDTVDCATGVDPGDAATTVDSVIYGVATRTVSLALQGGPLADGRYRLLVCATALDEAGNALDGNADGTGGDDFARTFTVDATPPRVSTVGSEPDTGDGQLTEGEATQIGPTHLTVSFNEGVFDPAGDSEPDDVTNPANHLLFSDGGDGFDTTDCATGVDAGDVAVAVDGVAYDAGQRIATLAVNGGSPLGEARYRLLVCGTTSVVDLAGSPLDGDGDGSGGDDFVRSFIVDQTPPLDPSVASTTHVPGTWSNLATIGVDWSGASDAGGSGVWGYSFLFDTAPTTLPDAVIDLSHVSDPHADSSGPLADGANHFFHLRTCDIAANCTQTVHLGPFQIDTAPPAAPSGLSSPSHPVGVPANDATIEVSWDPAVDATSGIDGYAFAFDASFGWACDQSPDLNETVTDVVSPALADGSWYVHVCAVDLAGNWSGVASAGPFVIDGAPPTVIHVTSVAGTRDGALSPGEKTPTSVTQLYVTFSESVRDPGGDSDPDDVTNPENYVLFSRGEDGVFDTVDCAGDIDPADLPIAVDEILHDAPLNRAMVRINGGIPLGPASYRLLVCGTTSIADQAGNALDGDADGTGGDDFALDFRIEVTNLLSNPNFDDDLAAWELSSPLGTEINHSNLDADEAPTSGSVEIVNLSGAGSLFSVAQCVDVTEEEWYWAGGRPRVASSLADDPLVSIQIDFFDQPACGGASQQALAAAVQGDTGEAWLEDFAGWVEAPATSVSARVSFALDAGQASSFDANLDSLLFYEMMVVFEDGFESGGTSEWSSVVED